MVFAMIDRKDIEATITRMPSVGPVLRRLADKMARGVALPVRFSVGELGYAAQRELEGLLGVVGNRTSTGRVSFPLPDELRDPSAWQEAQAHCSIANTFVDGKRVVNARFQQYLQYFVGQSCIV